MRRNKKKRKKQSSSCKVKNPKTRQRDYISDGASSITNMYALETERIKTIIKLILEVIAIIGGIALIFCNVRDDDFCLKISNFQLQCSLAGLVIIIISFYALSKTNPKINIKNEK